MINLVKAIEKSAEVQSDDPFLVAMAERAKAVQDTFAERQTSTEKALADLFLGNQKGHGRGAPAITQPSAPAATDQ